MNCRDRLRSQLVDMSSTGCGFSQSECYRTLVQIEGLVNEGHHCSPEECLQLGRRLEQILDGARGTLSVNDVKTIRRITRPFTRANPLVKPREQAGPRTGRAQRAAATPSESSAIGVLPPIASASKRDVAPSPGADSTAPSERRGGAAGRNSVLNIPARKPRQRSEWDAVILKRDEDDLRQVDAEKQLARKKKDDYRAEVIAQRAELEEQRWVAKQQKKVDQKMVASKVSEYRDAEEAEASKRKKKADQLRRWNEEGLAQRAKIIEAEGQEVKRIEETLIDKSRKDEKLAQAKDDQKRAKQQEYLKKANALNDRNRVIQAEEATERVAEEKRIAKMAQEIVEKREREREEYIEGQRNR